MELEANLETQSKEVEGGRLQTMSSEDLDLTVPETVRSTPGHFHTGGKKSPY